MNSGRRFAYSASGLFTKGVFRQTDSFRTNFNLTRCFGSTTSFTGRFNNVIKSNMSIAAISMDINLQRGLLGVPLLSTLKTESTLADAQQGLLVSESLLSQINLAEVLAACETCVGITGPVVDTTRIRSIESAKD